MIGQQLRRIQRLDDTIDFVLEAVGLEFVFEPRQPLLRGRDFGDDSDISDDKWFPGKHSCIKRGTKWWWNIS